MSENVMGIIDLIKQHPDLPIIPMVATEVVCDDCYGYWKGSWGDSKVDTYLEVDDGEGGFRLYTRSKDYDTVIDEVWDEDENQSYSRDDIERIVDALDWKKAIVVYIDLPEA